MRVLGEHEAGVEAAALGQEVGQHVAVAAAVGQPGQAALRDVAQFREAQAQVVEGNGERFAVEVPPADGDGRAVRLPEDERVVGCAVELDFHDPTCILDGIVARAMHLGNAAERVSVLHVRVVGRPDEGGPGQQRTQVRGALVLAGMRPGRVNERIQRQVRWHRLSAGHVHSGLRSPLR